MNLKKVKGAPKGVQRLYQELDKVVTSEQVSDSLEDRASKVEEYTGNLSKLVEDGLSTEQDIIQSLDEILDQDVKDDIARELSEKFDWPETLDDDLWPYVKGAPNIKEVLNVIELSSFLSEEDRVVLVDDILDAYGQVEE